MNSQFRSALPALSHVARAVVGGSICGAIFVFIGSSLFAAIPAAADTPLFLQIRAQRIAENFAKQAVALAEANGVLSDIKADTAELEKCSAMQNPALRSLRRWAISKYFAWDTADRSQGQHPCEFARAVTEATLARAKSYVRPSGHPDLEWNLVENEVNRTRRIRDFAAAYCAATLLGCIADN